MAKPINADTGNLPVGSENICCTMYVSPTGDIWVVPERDYPDFKLGSGDGMASTPQQPLIRTTFTPTTIVSNDFTIVFKAPGITQPLPNLAVGKLLNLKNLSGGTVTLSAFAIDTQITVDLSDGESLQVQQLDNLGSYIVL